MDINKIKLIENLKSGHYILGLSGGADSVALFHVLRNNDISFTAVYVNHGLRESASKDEVFIKELCFDYSIRLKIRAVDINDYQEKQKSSVEEAGRILRYDVLFGIAEEEDADGVLVAHHLDDQAESILMHLLRGSGLDGLSGMQEWTIPNFFHDLIPLIRPLLGISKKEILSFCEENEHSFIEDESNQDEKYRRNLIRNKIFPVLEEFNPQVKSKLVQLGKIANDENDFLEHSIEAIEKDIFNYYDLQNRFIKINRDLFIACHAALQKRLLRKAIKFVRPNSRNIGYKTITKIQEEIGGDFTTNRLYYEDHLLLIFHYDVCYLCRKADAMAQVLYPQVSEDLEVELKTQTVNLNDYDVLQIEEITREDFQNRDVDDLMSAVIDGDQLNRIIVTRKKAQDRIQPLGFRGQSKKISTLFIDLKIHREARDSYPVLRDADGKIIWVPGFKISIDYPICDTTKRFVKLQLCKRNINKNTV